MSNSKETLTTASDTAATKPTRWVCRTCWRSGEADGLDAEDLHTNAVSAHLKAMLQNEKRRPGDFPGVKMERFPAAMHAPDFIFDSGEPVKKKRFQKQTEGLFEK